MNLEIVEFYPVERNDSKESLNGTLRIKLPDLGIHILGIFATKRKTMYFFNMPAKFGFDNETGKQVRYPVFVFEDKEKQKQFMEAIKINGRAFIEDWLEKTECFNNSLSNETTTKQGNSQGACKSPTEAKETTYKSKQALSVSVKEYQNPPPLKKSFRRGAVGSKTKR